MRLTILTLAILVVLAPAWGQTCSNATTQGTYGFVCTGFISPAPNAPQVPFTALGTAQADHAGYFTGVAKASFGGSIVEWTVGGQAQTKSDCTGTIVYDQKINGQPAGQITINYLVLDEGKQIRGMPINTGTNISCNLKRMTRSQSAAPSR